MKHTVVAPTLGNIKKGELSPFYIGYITLTFLSLLMLIAGVAILNLSGDPNFTISKKRAFYIIPSSVIILIILVKFIGPEAELNNYRSKVIRGEIVNKYIDSSNHNAETLEYIDKNQKVKSVVIPIRGLHFYENARMNDSLKKVQGSEILFLLRNGIVDTVNLKK